MEVFLFLYLFIIVFYSVRSLYLNNYDTLIEKTKRNSNENTKLRGNENIKNENKIEDKNDKIDKIDENIKVEINNENIINEIENLHKNDFKNNDKSDSYIKEKNKYIDSYTRYIKPEHLILNYTNNNYPSYKEYFYPIDTKFKRAIVFLAFKRCKLFEQVIKSYLSSSLFPYYDIIVSMETNNFRIPVCMTRLVNMNKNNIKYIFTHVYPKFKEKKLKVGPPKITHHYFVVLEKLFREYNYDYVYVAEDDILATADTLDYLIQTEKLLRIDNSLFCLNTFNRQAKVGLVQSSKRLFRTDMNVGWGWLLGRDKGLQLLYEWPLFDLNYVWDNWVLMFMNIHKYECISPEIPRSQHIGKKGVTMNVKSFTMEAVREYSKEKEVFSIYIRDLILAI